LSSRYEVENDLDFNDTREQDREISLGTTTILGIFLALALLCAVFFGFGYSLGKRSAHPTPAADEPVAASSENTAAKPAPGSFANQTAGASLKPTAGASQSSVSASDATDTPETAADQSPQIPAPIPVKVTPPSSQPALHAETVVKPSPKAAVAVPAVAATPSTGVALVQVAAVSHQEDADVLVTALKRRGYSVTVRHEPQDKLLHVQIGPFATKKEADAMRQHLQTDGYNAIVK
jgi:DedD protein